MKGNIYTKQRCPVCHGKLRHDDRRGGCFCPAHGCAATGRFEVKYGREIRRVFPTYAEAARFLVGMRFKEDEGTLDARDYMRDNPLDIDKLVDDYLTERRHRGATVSNLSTAAK